MKKLFISLLFIYSLLLQAQKNDAPLIDEITSTSYLLVENQLINGEQVTESINATFGDSYSYKKEYSIQVNARLDYEIGEIHSKNGSYALMFVHSKKHDNTSQIEFLIAYKKDNTNLTLSELDTPRDRWMELCNKHQVTNLVTELYHKDAYYYNRGRLIQGSEAITKEYAYMKSPNYQLMLSPKHILMVNDAIAYELGRCSGSYPLPYLLLWEKQKDGNWQIIMDSNF